MFAASKVMGVSGTAAISSLFKVNTRTGTGSAGSVTSALFTPDLVISKGRSGATGWTWATSAEGTGKYFDSASTSGLITDAQTVTAFNSNGFSFGTASQINTNADTYADFMLKKAAGFLDIGTATGNASGAQTINHNLGVAPGFIIFLDAAGTTEFTWHNAFTLFQYIALNSTAARVGAAQNTIVSTSSTQFAFNTNIMLNANTDAFQWLAFAHDTSASSKIYCGTFTTDGSQNATVSGLPFQPQFILYKVINTTGNWQILDTTRGWGSGNDAILAPNTTAAEAGAADFGAPTSDGFSFPNGLLAKSAPYIYMAINSI